MQTDEVKIKKYFYVLRPILACIWIEKHNESPPMEFETLLTLIDDNALSDSVNKLLAKKRSGVELGLEPKIHVINNFIESALTHFESTVNSFDPKQKPNARLLGEGFVRVLDYCEGDE